MTTSEPEWHVPPYTHVTTTGTYETYSGNESLNFRGFMILVHDGRRWPK
ncbi:hypothetical protein GCM10023350_25130 [Nocardioides endophyticus]|uniref:Uncharacterized protein n=1 Tax=Nocardioides endophyticus TaxID=1353775 RepID=A0ABP8YWF2_9ACTN